MVEAKAFLYWNLSLREREEIETCVNTDSLMNTEIRVLTIIMVVIHLNSYYSVNTYTVNTHQTWHCHILVKLIL